jgi:hypothetical protein
MIATQVHKELLSLVLEVGILLSQQTKKRPEQLQASGSKVVNGGFTAMRDTVSFPEKNKATSFSTPFRLRLS